MSESEDTTATAPPQPQSESDSTSTIMEVQPSREENPQHTNSRTSELGRMGFSIWPPTQKTRDAVVTRLVETLSSPSVLSDRYGTMPHEESFASARLIEEEAFSAAGSSSAPEDDGIQILQVYSKEISKRMLETVKSKAASASPQPDTAITTEETPNVETESS